MYFYVWLPLAVFCVCFLLAHSLYAWMMSCQSELEEEDEDFEEFYEEVVLLSSSGPLLAQIVARSFFWGYRRHPRL